MSRSSRRTLSLRAARSAVACFMAFGAALTSSDCRFTSISCGTDHVLAVTSKSRAFATPINLAANKYGQLGVRHVALLSLHASALSSGEQHVSLIPDLLLNDRTVLPPPPKRLDPLLLPHGASPPQLAPQLELDPVVAPRPVPVRDIRLHEDEAQHTALENDIRFATTLHEIPALKDIPIAELVAGSRHSVARTTDGKVLGFGANDYGQLGMPPRFRIESTVADPARLQDLAPRSRTRQSRRRPRSRSPAATPRRRASSANG